MSKKDNGGAAFPEGVAITPMGDMHVGDPGMSLRDWFAGQVAAGSSVSLDIADQEKFAAYCYAVADAMLAERKKEDKNST